MPICSAHNIARVFWLDIKHGKGPIVHCSCRVTEHSVTDLCVSKVNQVGNLSRSVICLPFDSDHLPSCKELDYQYSLTQIVSVVGVA